MSITDLNIKDFLELGGTLTIQQGSHSEFVLKQFVEIAVRKNTILTIILSSSNITFIKDLIKLGGKNLEVHIIK